MNKQEPAIGVLIVNYFTYQDTKTFVANLKQQKRIRLYILIVDNCSPNESFPLLQENFKSDPMVQVLQSEKNGGYAYGNNFGLNYFRTKPLDYILISNNDIEIEDPDLLYQMVDAHRKLDNVGFVAPRMYVGEKENIKHQAYKIPRYKDSLFASLRSLYWLAQKLNRTNAYPFAENDTRDHPVDCVSGAFFLGAKNVFFEIGLFDDRTFLYGEEAILGKKIAAIGKQNYQLRSLSINHIDGRTTRSLKTQYQLQKEWLTSTVYYHQQYEKCSAAGIALLKILYGVWVLETRIIDLIRKFGRG